MGAAAALASAAFVHQRAWQAERASPPSGRFVDVHGVSIHYLDRGEGTPLVMLHGLGSMIQELRLSGLYELVAARYRVIIPDRPGYGHSSRPRRTWWTPQAQAALLRAMLVQLGIERPVLFGHSFGALVAMAFALEYPAATRGLVLASGYYFPTARLDAALMAPPALPLVGDLMRHTISPLISRMLWPLLIRRQFSPAPVPRYFELFPTWMALRPRSCARRRKTRRCSFLLRCGCSSSTARSRSRRSSSPERRTATSTTRATRWSSRGAFRAASSCCRRAPATWCITSIRAAC